jgi:hypothetical protein
MEELMSRLFSFAALLCLLLSLLACSESSTKPKVESLVYQVGRCDHNMILGSSAVDSCFAATFAQDLVVDFCLSANCCPDTSRFALMSVIRNDTIVIMATDTAQNLCHCLCEYTVRAEFHNPPLARYVVMCSYRDSLYFLMTVERPD